MTSKKGEHIGPGEPRSRVGGGPRFVRVPRADLNPAKVDSVRHCNRLAQTVAASRAMHIRNQSRLQRFTCSVSFELLPLLPNCHQHVSNMHSKSTNIEPTWSQHGAEMLQNAFQVASGEPFGATLDPAQDRKQRAKGPPNDPQDPPTNGAQIDEISTPTSI